MNSTVVVINIVAIFFLVLILVGVKEVPVKSLQDTNVVGMMNKFICCVLTCISGLTVEAVSLFLLNSAVNSHWVIGLNLMAFIIFSLNFGFYMQYTSKVIELFGLKFPEEIQMIAWGFLGINIVSEVILTVEGKLFSIENGKIINSYWAYISYIIPLLVFLVCFINMLKLKKEYQASEALDKYILALMPYVVIAVLVHFKAIGHGFMCIAIVYEIIYMTFQSKMTLKANISAQIYNELSTVDILTGLLNRRGYQEYIDKLKCEEKIAVVFADVNSLKAVNDNLGHYEGDRRIKKVAEILRNVFDGDGIFRISGDEFVCISRIQTESAFRSKVLILKDIIYFNNRIASYGFSIGFGKEIYDVIKRAELEMYKDKKKYYTETGNDRRR
ncbi:MAG: GGDEF domain-containing protein [Lachnospiraceae bacterium]|nr:GGDEF domain-containing protein [Lachnospiraceae bacterium]